MLRQLAAVAAIGAAVLTLPLAAEAAQAFTAHEVSVHTGPGRRYPVIRTVGPGREVFVGRCTRDGRWCEVSRRRLHGWVWAGALSYPRHRPGHHRY